MKILQLLMLLEWNLLQLLILWMRFSIGKKKMNKFDRLTDMVDTMIENGEIVPNDKPEFEGEDE